MHINNQHVRHGPVDASGLLIAKDVTEDVAAILPGVGGRITEMQQVIAQKNCPVVEIGPHCDAPYSCPLKESCWAKHWEAEAANATKGDLEWDPPAIRRFLNGLTWPIYLLDFETFATAIPLFDACSPYQQAPFQFSLHVVERLETEPKHVSWLWDGVGDPREIMLAELRKAIGPIGSVLAYNKRFEEGCLNRSAAAIPAHAGWVRKLMLRMMDLADPVRSHAVRHPTLGRKWSLKIVLPLLTGKGYDELAIADGNTASAEFLRVTFAEADSADCDAVRKNLEEYCGQDTRGMLDILRRMEDMAQGSATEAVKYSDRTDFVS